MLFRSISLAVIGFALAAIVGVLPFGMNVQKENREETIINQDQSIFVNAIRNGEKGLDDLTNYVYAITNWVTEFGPGKPKPLYTLGYTYLTSSRDGTTMSPPFPITNGFRIVGLLSTPKLVFFDAGKVSGFRSNHVVAYVRALSGNASEKFPQNNPSVQDLAFTYRMISEVFPYNEFERNWTNFNDQSIAGNTNEITTRSNFWMLTKTMQANLYDLRLIFRYPFLPNGKTGDGRLVFRTGASGSLQATNEAGFPTDLPYQIGRAHV